MLLLNFKHSNWNIKFATICSSLHINNKRYYSFLANLTISSYQGIYVLDSKKKIYFLREQGIILTWKFLRRVGYSQYYWTSPEDLTRQRKKNCLLFTLINRPEFIISFSRKEYKSMQVRKREGKEMKRTIYWK